MTNNPSAAKALRACGIDIPVLQTELDSYIEDNTPLLTEQDPRENPANFRLSNLLFSVRFIMCKQRVKAK